MAMLNNQRVYIYIMIYTYAVAAQCALLMCSPRKPSVVMFGEDLPDRFWDLQEDDLRKCVAGRCAWEPFKMESPYLIMVNNG